MLSSKNGSSIAVFDCSFTGAAALEPSPENLHFLPSFSKTRNFFFFLNVNIRCLFCFWAIYARNHYDNFSTLNLGSKLRGTFSSMIERPQFPSNLSIDWIYPDIVVLGYCSILCASATGISDTHHNCVQFPATSISLSSWWSLILYNDRNPPGFGHLPHLRVSFFLVPLSRLPSPESQMIVNFVPDISVALRTRLWGPNCPQTKIIFTSWMMI